MNRLKLKVAVYILLVKEDKILLTRRANTGWQDGSYGIPAGHLEADETVEEALFREVKEEVGIDLKDVEFVHVMHRKNVYVDFYFLAKDWTGEPENKEQDKCDDVRWFSIEELPGNMIPSVRFAIDNYKKNLSFSEFMNEG
jgi:8-oxo-dGTP diphosphatase